MMYNKKDMIQENLELNCLDSLFMIPYYICYLFETHGFEFETEDVQ